MMAVQTVHQKAEWTDPQLADSMVHWTAEKLEAKKGCWMAPSMAVKWALQWVGRTVAQMVHQMVVHWAYL